MTEYYSAAKRNGLLVRATASTNLKTIVLSDGIQTQRSTRYTTPFIVKCSKRQLIGSGGTQSRGCLQGGRDCNGGADGNFWRGGSAHRLDCVGGCVSAYVRQNLSSRPLKMDSVLYVEMQFIACQRYLDKAIYILKNSSNLATARSFSAKLPSSK